MKSVLFLIAGIFAVAPIAAFEREGNVITLDAEDMTACINGHGCALITKDVLDELRATQAKPGHCKES